MCGRIWTPRIHAASSIHSFPLTAPPAIRALSTWLAALFYVILKDAFAKRGNRGSFAVL